MSVNALEETSSIIKSCSHDTRDAKIYFLIIAKPKKILCEYSKYSTIYDDYTMKILNTLKPGRKIISYKKVLYIYIKDTSDDLVF